MSMSRRPLVHEPDCGRPDVDWRAYPDRPSWRFGRCSTCRATGWREVTQDPPPAPPPAPTSLYVCREHPDVPVTRRGTGCPRCAEDRRRTPEDPDLYLWSATNP